ncbi:MAG: Cu(I)-responsive transcriptional regulator [Sulfitobacter sp.]
MNISAAAKAAGLPVKTVRYYADIGLVNPAGRSEAGYRVYDAASLRKLSFIRRARAFDFSIEDCRELLDLYQDRTRPSAEVKHIAANRLAQIEQKQKELQSLRDELAHLVTACRGDDRPDCPIIDYLG